MTQQPAMLKPAQLTACGTSGNFLGPAAPTVAALTQVRGMCWFQPQMAEPHALAPPTTLSPVARSAPGTVFGGLGRPLVLAPPPVVVGVPPGPEALPPQLCMGGMLVQGPPPTQFPATPLLAPLTAFGAAGGHTALAASHVVEAHRSAPARTLQPSSEEQIALETETSRKPAILKPARLIASGPAGVHMVPAAAHVEVAS